MSEQVEISINIKETPKRYVDNLILALVHSGYDTYFDFEKENICFTGWKDELVKDIKKD